MTEHYTIKELAKAKGTSAPVRAALLALEARVLELEDALGFAIRTLYEEGSTEKGPTLTTLLRVHGTLGAALGDSHDQ